MNNTNIDLTAPIWDKVYQVMVPRIATIPLEEMEEYGTYTTTITAIDKDSLKQNITVYWNIDKIVEAFRDGHGVHIPNRSDTIAIYDAIQAYLNSWVGNMQGVSLNAAYAPVDDLQLMDEVANRLYEYVGYEYINNGPPTTDLFKALNPNQSVDEIFKQVIKPGENESIEPRESLKDFFDKGILGPGVT